MRPTRFEWILLLLATLLLAWQLLLPGYIGLANNGDFPKVCSRFDLAPPGGWRNDFIYFVPDYRFSPQNHWVSPVLSSEIAVAAVPILLVRATGSSVFNIRWLGALNILLFLLALYVALRSLRRLGPFVQALAAAAIVWIAGDVCYTAYLNSFYSDSVAIAGLLLAFAAAAAIAIDEDAPAPALFAVFAIGGIFLITSKAQHGAFFLAPAVFALWSARRAPRLRVAAWVLAATLTAGFVFDLAAFPESLKAEALYNLIFLKIGPLSPHPLADLKELGLSAADAKFIGENAFMPDSPVNDDAGAHRFLERTSQAAVLRFYFHHPSQALQILTTNLESEAPQMRPRDLSNFPRSAGMPPGSRTGRFASWSDLRSWLFRAWPWYIVVWFVLFTAGAGLMLAKPLSIVGLGTAAVAVGEFVLASLADGGETYRHLLLFHLLTDLTILLAIVWAFSRVKSVMLRSLWRN